MAEQRSRSPSGLLEPPAKGVELEDPGAEDHGSDSGDDHFSDASEGLQASLRATSPIPRTRVEKVDFDPSYGENPGSLAYEQRLSDSVPDEIVVIDGTDNMQPTSPTPELQITRTSSPIPSTIVEKVDPSLASYGEEPGTDAYESRKADAPPDHIFKFGDPRAHEPQSSPDDEVVATTNEHVPETLLSRVESIPEDTDQKSFVAHHKRHASDAIPDSEEIVTDTPVTVESDLEDPAVGKSDTSSERKDHPSKNEEMSHIQEAEIDEEEENDNDGGGGDENAEFADDFDDFEEGGGAADADDFGEFDDAFQEPIPDIPGEQLEDISSAPSLTQPLPPFINFDSVKSLPDLLSITSDQLDSLFPGSTNVATLPPPEAFSDSSAIFTTDRSLSLWSQLVAPPPLQPPNWIKSRIRRLFLVSIGVPVDLDEILPASKQKKLVLPSINPQHSAHTSLDPNARGKVARSRSKRKPIDGQSRSSTSVDSRSSSQQPNNVRAGKNYDPSPELDLSAVRRLCATTDAALDGFTEDEMKEHVQNLEQMTLQASKVLEYWLKKRDSQLGEKEAFEGVIENLVKHARQVRK
ncbi:hypothetical protein FQN57_004210 [Myotisia sp. PD_48]|nr:hypothetical protein FQN57_004210 [Myotisia sp. PD_48]